MSNGIKYCLCTKESVIYNSPYVDEIDTFTGEYTSSEFQNLLYELKKTNNPHDPLYIKLIRGDKEMRSLPVVYKEDEYTKDMVLMAFKDYLYEHRGELRSLIYLVTPGFKTNIFKTDHEKSNKRLFDESFHDSTNYDLLFEIERFLHGYLNSYLKYRDTYFFLKMQGITFSHHKKEYR